MHSRMCLQCIEFLRGTKIPFVWEVLHVSNEKRAPSCLVQGIIPATATPILGDYHKPLQETPYLNNQDSMDFVRDPGFFGGSSGIMEQSITSAEIREGTLIGAVSLSKVFIIGRTVYRSSTANGAQPLKHPPKFIGPLLGTITYPHLGGMFEEDFPFPKGGYGVVPS